ncbi:hypothetical protein GCM10009844_11270 [Nocardioides koreensis]|uniref:N-acetyltransferase domain-containing protein n=1 Tax=Nocardioides koreensis TaxID=433651 RepID=A0ABN2ZEQ0_9ACTN
MTEQQTAHLGAVTAGIGAAELDRIAALTGEMDAHHPHAPHLYLWFLGVHASRRGQGWGGRLLEARLARADEQSLPSYLEATSPRNRALYERHGFEVIGEISTEGSPPMWQMWRDCR